MHDLNFMVYVYAIKSLKENYIYVGLTVNLDRRIREHNTGRSKTTRSRTPFTIIIVEEYPNRVLARTREKFLKSGAGKEYLKSLI